MRRGDHRRGADEAGVAKLGGEVRHTRKLKRAWGSSCVETHLNVGLLLLRCGEANRSGDTASEKIVCFSVPRRRGHGGSTTAVRRQRSGGKTWARDFTVVSVGRTG